MFSFGDHALWEQEPNPKGSRLRNFQDASQRLMQFALPLFSARGIFQYNHGLIPYRNPVDTIGKLPVVGVVDKSAAVAVVLSYSDVD